MFHTFVTFIFSTGTLPGSSDLFGKEKECINECLQKILIKFVHGELLPTECDFICENEDIFLRLVMKMTSLASEGSNNTQFLQGTMTLRRQQCSFLKRKKKEVNYLSRCCHRLSAQGMYCNEFLGQYRRNAELF